MVRGMKRHYCTQYLLNIYGIMNIKCSFPINKQYIKHFNDC